MIIVVMKKSWCFFNDLLSAQIHFALSVYFGAAMSRWGNIIVNKTKKLLRVLFGTPPRAYLKFKRYVSTLCLTGAGRLARKLLLCQALPNGDWDDKTCVQVWLPPGTRYCLDKLGQLVGQSIAELFAATDVPLYNKHRPSGAATAVGRFAMR